jgi:hypothetical protein
MGFISKLFHLITTILIGLSSFGLDVTKEWAFWRAGRGKLNLAAADPMPIAEAVRSALDQ